MLENGSWCGEMHIQKAAYFLRELGEVPLGFVSSSIDMVRFHLISGVS